MISKELREALQSWLADATSDEPSNEVRTFGLCMNVGMQELGRLLEREFPAGYSYPFDDGGDYYVLARREEQHLNPVRLAWVRAKLEDA